MRTLVFDDRFPLSVSTYYELLWEDTRFMKLYFEALGDQDIDVSDWTEVDGILQRKVKHKRSFMADGFRALAGQNVVSCESTQLQLWIDDDHLNITNKLKLDASFFRKYVQIQIDWIIRTCSSGCQVIEKVFFEVNQPDKVSVVEDMLIQICHAYHSEYVRLARSDIAKYLKRSASQENANRSAAEKNARLNFYESKVPRLRKRLQKIETQLTEQKKGSSPSSEPNKVASGNAGLVMDVTVVLLFATLLLHLISNIISPHGVLSFTHDVFSLAGLLLVGLIAFEVRKEVRGV